MEYLGNKDRMWTIKILLLVIMIALYDEAGEFDSWIQKCVLLQINKSGSRNKYSDAQSYYSCYCLSLYLYKFYFGKDFSR